MHVFCTLQFEPVELHVVDALGQQDVPEYFQPLAKAVSEDVNVTRDPQGQAWIQALLEEIASFKKLGVLFSKNSRENPSLCWVGGGG